MIGGNICIRDGESTDFMWREAVESLLPVCSTVYICDGGSTDGTLQAIEKWCSREPRLRLTHFPWSSPVGQTHLWVTWLNHARSHITEPWHFQLDADEVLSPASYDWIRDFTSTPREASAWCHRFNFWRDPWHLLPDGKVCGTRVARLASTSLWMPTDYPHPLGEDLCRMAVGSPIQIYHYGWLRRREAMIQKQRRYMNWTVGGDLDPRLTAAETAANWCEEVATQCGWRGDVTRFQGEHPEVAKQWLRDRGYNPDQPVYE